MFFGTGGGEDAADADAAGDDAGAGDDAADAGDGADSIKLFLNNKVCEICVSRIYFEIYKK